MFKNAKYYIIIFVYCAILAFLGDALDLNGKQHTGLYTGVSMIISSVMVWKTKSGRQSEEGLAYVLGFFGVIALITIPFF